MHISVSEAKGRLTDLVRRAEAGDEVVLTRHGQPAARIVAVEQEKSIDRDALRARRRAILEEVIAAARERGPHRGPPAEQSGDFLYGEDGLPA